MSENKIIKNNKCRWTHEGYTEPDLTFYKTSCNEDFYLPPGHFEGHYNFCPKCGKTIIEE